MAWPRKLHGSSILIHDCKGLSHKHDDDDDDDDDPLNHRLGQPPTCDILPTIAAFDLILIGDISPYVFFIVFVFFEK